MKAPHHSVLDNILRAVKEETFRKRLYFSDIFYLIYKRVSTGFGKVLFIIFIIYFRRPLLVTKFIRKVTVFLNYRNTVYRKAANKLCNNIQPIYKRLSESFLLFKYKFLK